MHIVKNEGDNDFRECAKCEGYNTKCGDYNIYIPNQLIWEQKNRKELYK